MTLQELFRRLKSKPDYKKLYDLYHSSPSEIKKRSSRNKTRRKLKRRKLDNREVDHIDRNPLNNAPSNLRVVSLQKNRPGPKKKKK